MSGTDHPDRPDPENDPFACSICGEPLGITKRLEREEYCDACLRDHGFFEEVDR